MDRWKRYLFESHPEPALRAWAKRLRFFRFLRAYGGHANDGDSLIAVYRYGSLEDLQGFFAFLGISLVDHSERPPQPEPGVAYPGGEISRFPSLIPGTAWIEQPGHCEIAGRKAFVWCGAGRIRISLAQGYEVTEADVVSAEAVERALQGAPLERVEPPVDDKHCICPKYYPEYFASTVS